MKMHTAVYHEQKLELYQGNPCIEAIPPVISAEEFVVAVTRYPFPKDFYEFDVNDKLDLLENFEKVYFPIPNSYQLFLKIHRLIRSSYVSRNPLDDEYKADFDKLQQNVYPNRMSVEGGSSLKVVPVVGHSRTSKTSTVRGCLHIIPQVILHEGSKYGVRLIQVVWLSIDFIETKTIIGFLHSILRALDKAIGSNYFQKFSAKSTNITTLRQEVLKLLWAHNVGIIHMDEMQNIAVLKSNGELDFKFIDAFFNHANIHVIWSSIPKIEKAISGNLTTQFRLFNGRLYFFDPFEIDSADWKKHLNYYLLPGMLNYDLQFDDQFCSMAHDFTFGLPGIVNILMTLFYETALEAYLDDFSEFCPKEHLFATYTNYFGAFHKAITALRSNKADEFEDIVSERRLKVTYSRKDKTRLISPPTEAVVEVSVPEDKNHAAGEKKPRQPKKVEGQVIKASPTSSRIQGTPNEQGSFLNLAELSDEAMLKLLNGQGDTL